MPGGLQALLVTIDVVAILLVVGVMAACWFLSETSVAPVSSSAKSSSDPDVEGVGVKIEESGACAAKGS